MKIKPPILLLGADCLTGLQTSRILWKQNVPVIGVANDPRSPYCRTRAAVRIVPAAKITNDPRPLLLKLREQYGMRPVVMACTDDFIWWLDEHRDAVREHADFLLSPPKTLHILADKVQLYRYAMEYNLPLPETRFVTCREELMVAAREMTFPLILKPPRRSPDWMKATGGFKVLKVDDAEALVKTGMPLLPIVDELILQAWVRGPDANMHSLYICLDRQSEPRATLVAKKLRQWPPDIGVGCLAVEVCVDEIVTTGLSILKRLGYIGPGSFQFKQDTITKKFYIIEMNTRSALNFPLCEACGVEMTYSCYCAAADLPLPENRTITRPGGKWICWKTDLPSALAHWRRGDLTVREWLTSIRGHKWSADIQWNDPIPLLADMARKITHGLSRRATTV